jgi:peptide/nickel transport system substrate-binding protein
VALIAGVGAIVAFAYVRPGDSSSGAAPERGGTYVEGVAGAPGSINPLFASFNQIDRDLSALVFAGMMRLGPGGDVQPDLAQSMKVTPDGLTYIFELRDGLLWHDGERVTSDDVVFTVGAIQDPNFRGDPTLADAFEGVVVAATDQRTVTMTLPAPFAPFPARAATVGILPQHLLGGAGAALLADAPFNQQPIGSGPFELIELTEDHALLAPFPAYHLGEPHLESLEVRFYRDDASLLNALLSEEVDGMLLRPGLAEDEVGLIDGDDRWQRRPLHTTAFSVVFLNANLPTLASGQLRRALQHGIDREVLIENALAGQALPVDSPIVRDLWSSIATPDAFAYDPDLAAELLDAEGWALTPNGREQDGEPLRFTLAASDDPTQVAVGQELARQWAELGVQVDVQTSGASQFVEGVLIPRAFEAALVSVDPGPDPDPYPLWHSSQAFGDGRNLSSYSDVDADRLLENGRLTTSPAQRATDYRAFQEIYANDVPAVLLYTATYQYVVRSDVRGLAPGLLTTLSARFSDVPRWFVAEAGDDGSD